MDIEQIVSGLLEVRHNQLSLLAREGYGKQGRGAILLEIYIDESPKTREAEVDVYLVGYRSYQALSKMDLDQPFYHLLKDYDPFDRGVIAFGANSSSLLRRSGFFWFRLSTKADQRIH